MIFLFILKMFAAIAAWLLFITWYEHQFIQPPLQDACYRLLRRHGRLTAKEIQAALYDEKYDHTMHQVYVALHYLEAEGLINRERVEVEGEPFARYYYSPTGKPKLIKSTTQLNNDLVPTFSHATVLE